MDPLLTRQGVADYLAQARDVADWSRRCEQVKLANGSKYPAFWFDTVFKSGLHERTRARWMEGR